MRLRALVAWPFYDIHVTTGISYVHIGQTPPSSLQGLYLQRPSEVFAHRPAASNKFQFSYGIQQINQTPSKLDESKKDI